MMPVESFTKMEKYITEAFQSDDPEEAFDTTKNLLNASDLSNEQLAELMLSVFKAGKSAGREDLKTVIASL